MENKASPTKDGAVTFRRNSYQIGGKKPDRFAFRGKTMTWSQWQHAGSDQDSVRT